MTERRFLSAIIDWSAAGYIADAGSAWVMDFQDGGDGAGTESVNFYVRAVRGGL